MDELEHKYIKFIDTYLSSKNLTETCKKIKITRSTAYRYLKEDIVKAEIDKRRGELINDTTLYLQARHVFYLSLLLLYPLLDIYKRI